MEKLLSIAIPTFNREKHLKDELECILPQLQQFRDQVEIVISDNASPYTDHTESMVKELEIKYSITIDYKKLAEPIYFEDNFKEVVSRTRGKYVHMTGDDDLFSNDFYRIVFDLLKKEYGLIHFNRLEGDSNCSNTKVFDTCFDHMIYVAKTEDFAKRVMRAPGFMTSLIFRRDCWDEGEKFDSENYYGYHFLGRLYQGAIRLGLESCYYYMPLIVVRNQAHDWGKKFPLFYYVGYSNIFKDIEPYSPGIYEKWLDFLHNHEKERHFRILATVLLDKQLYIDKQMEMEEFMSKKQIRAFRFLLNSLLPAKLTRFFYYNLFIK